MKIIKKKKNNFLKDYRDKEIDNFLYFLIHKNLLSNENLSIRAIEKYDFNFEKLYKRIFDKDYEYDLSDFLEDLEFFKENYYYEDLIGTIKEKLNENNFKKVETFLLGKGKKSFKDEKSKNKLYYDQINLLSILKVIDKKAYDNFIKEKIGDVFSKNKRERSNSETFI